MACCVCIYISARPRMTADRCVGPLTSHDLSSIQISETKKESGDKVQITSLRVLAYLTCPPFSLDTPSSGADEQMERKRDVSAILPLAYTDIPTCKWKQRRNRRMLAGAHFLLRVRASGRSVHYEGCAVGGYGVNGHMHLRVGVAVRGGAYWGGWLPLVGGQSPET